MTSRSMRSLWTMAEGLRHDIQSPLATTHNTLHTHAHACTPEHVCYIRRATAVGVCWVSPSPIVSSGSQNHRHFFNNAFVVQWAHSGQVIGQVCVEHQGGRCRSLGEGELGFAGYDA